MSDETAVATLEPMTPAVSAEVMEQVLIGGDLAKLSPGQRTEYYLAVCKSQGLNPLTKPFEYLNLNGKLRLYATKDCADQIRRQRGISFHSLTKEIIGDIYVVTAYARDREGREDSSTGAVAIKGKSGDDLANAYMKAETKAKRRATLSIAGLGWLDETETESLPAAALQAPAERPKAVTSAQAKAQEHEQRARETLLGAIKLTLQDRGLHTKEAKEARQQALTEAFGEYRWGYIESLSIPELQEGYVKLQHPGEVIDAEEDVPFGEAPDGEEPPSSASAEDEAPSGLATAQHIAGLKLLAQQVGEDAVREIADVLSHHPQGLPLHSYEVIQKHLQGRKAQATQGALV